MLAVAAALGPPPVDVDADADVAGKEEEEGEGQEVLVLRGFLLQYLVPFCIFGSEGGKEERREGRGGAAAGEDQNMRAPSA